MSKNIKSLLEKLPYLFLSSHIVDERPVFEAFEGANSFEDAVHGLAAGGTTDNVKYFESILRSVEQEILKPWSNRQGEFIVFNCHDDESFNPINCLSVLSALAFVKHDIALLEEISAVAVQDQHHPNAGLVMNNLGVMFTQTVLYEKSKECFSIAKSCFEYKEDHLKEAVATLNLAALHKVSGCYQNATYFCDATASLCHNIPLKMSKDSYQPERLLQRVAVMLEEFGNHEKSQDILRIASKASLSDLTKLFIAIQIKQQNGNHIDVEELRDFVCCLFSLLDHGGTDNFAKTELLNVEFLTAVMIVAKAFHNAGYLEEGCKLLEKLEDAFLTVHGRKNSLCGSLLCQIGRFNLRTGMFSEAESAFKQAEEILICNFGRSHHSVVSCKSLLGTCALLTGKTVEACKYLNEALAVVKNINQQHPEVAEILFKFAFLLAEEGNFQSAQRTINQAMDIFISACGEVSTKTAGGYAQSALILQKVDAFRASAIANMKKAIDTFLLLGLKNNHPDVLLCHSVLGLMGFKDNEVDDDTDNDMAFCEPVDPCKSSGVCPSSSRTCTADMYGNLLRSQSSEWEQLGARPKDTAPKQTVQVGDFLVEQVSTERESTENSSLALDQKIIEACAVIEQVLVERAECKQVGTEAEREDLKSRKIRELSTIEGRERKSVELAGPNSVQQAESSPEGQLVSAVGVEETLLPDSFSSCICESLEWTNNTPLALEQSVARSSILMQRKAEEREKWLQSERERQEKEKGETVKADISNVIMQGIAESPVHTLEPCHTDAALPSDNSRGFAWNRRDLSTNSTYNSMLLVEQHTTEEVLREECEPFQKEIERIEQLIREQQRRERSRGGASEIQEAERWPQQQEIIAACSQWLCEHYQRYCRVQFPCCAQFYPCHRCHNNSRACDNEEAKACHATHLKCSHCHHEQEIGEDSKNCRVCGGNLSTYFCSICKHFTSMDKSPYHCEKCGICRIHKDKSFHCEVCNVCLDKLLEGNHKCRPDLGH